MPDRKKVIKALEFCLMPTTEEELMSDVCSHDDCPYYRTYSGGKCVSAVCSDAFALLKAQEPIEARLHLCESCTKEYAECEADKTDLVYGSDVGNDNIIGCPWYVNRWKAQEPRVMTLEEVTGCKEPIFIENTPFSDWCLFCTSVDGDSWFSVGWRNGSVTKYKDIYYNKTWRCWTSRPDEKRRAETPWS